MEPLPTFMRERIVETVHEGFSIPEVAERFKLSVSAVRNYVELAAEGALEPKPRSGGPGTLLDDDDRERLRRAVEEQPDATLEEYRERCDFEASTVTICRELQKLGLSRKRKVPRAAEQNTEEVQRQRAEWRERTERVDPNRFVFVDEFGISTRMAKSYGRAPAGEPVYTDVPLRHYESLTVLGGMRLSGELPTSVYKGGTTTERMLDYVTGPLAEVLSKGDVVVADNLATHRSKRVAEALAEQGVEIWFLPPYSPDLNPIERLAGKVKAFLEKVRAEALPALRKALARALDRITEIDIRNWFDHSDYLQTA